MESKELPPIPVPWGYVAAKAWGDSSNPIILTFHGILDNAGSFDRLIPLLPNNYYYICFDLPGHGKSSHFPPFLPIYSLNYLFVYHLAMQHFGQEKYIIMGHSYGAQLAIVYAQLYPKKVEKLIMLDTLYLFPIEVDFYKSHLQSKLDDALETHKKLTTGKAPMYTYEEALDKICNHRRYGFLTQEAAEPLLKRLLTPAEVEGKFYFTSDQRLKFFFNPTEDFAYIAKKFKKYPIMCPVLIVLASDSKEQRKYFKPIFDLYRKSKLVTIRYAKGNHDVHNTDPELVAPHVTKFLLSFKNKL